VPQSASSGKTTDLTILSALSFNTQLTARKGRKEGISMAPEVAPRGRGPAFQLPFPSLRAEYPRICAKLTLILLDGAH
jgi:hypothetical protein